MATRIKRVAWLVLLAWTIGFYTPAKADAEGQSERFLREAPPKWKEYEAFVDRLQGLVDYKNIQNDKIIDNWKYEIKQNLNCKLTITRYVEVAPKSVNRKSTEKLNAYNRDYAFWLGRMDEGRPWLITGYDQRTDATSTSAEARTRREAMSIYALVSVQPAIRLSDLVRRPSFRVLDATRLSRERRELVQVTFENGHAPEETKSLPYCAAQSGTLLLDPARCWYLVSADLQEEWANSKGKHTIENAIAATDIDRPLPKESVSSWFLTLTNGEPYNYVNTYEFDLTAPATLPKDEEFTLSALGFPEPSFGPGKVGWHSPAVVSGIVLIGMAFLFRRLSKGRKSVAT